MELGAGGGEGTPRSARGIRGQDSGALEEGGRCGHAAPSLRPSRQALQVAGDLLVDSQRGLGTVPGPTGGIDLGVGGLGDRATGGAALFGRRRVLDHRAHQRVTEADLRTDQEQPVGLGGGGCVSADAHPFRRTPEQHGSPKGSSAAIRSSRRGVGGTRPDPAKEALLDPAGQRLPGDEPQTAGELGRRQAAAVNDGTPHGGGGCSQATTAWLQRVTRPAPEAGRKAFTQAGGAKSVPLR
jgi:hypothetical protein